MTAIVVGKYADERGAAAHMGCHTALLTFNVNALAKMSCNPAVGGV